MKPPFFSVITPSWNQGKFLRGCIESVLSQNDPDFEHLIFDNCSTDETGAVVADFPGVNFVSEPDWGQAHAVNKGMNRARGEIVCWLNSDDAYPPGTFARLREIFADPGVQIVFGDVRQIGYDGRVEEIVPARFGSRLDLVRYWKDDAKLHQPAIFFRRRLIEKTGLLREDLHFALDYEYWWRLSEIYDFVRVPEVLAIQHRQPESKTISQWHKVLEEREQIFSPFYHLIDEGRPEDLERERKCCLAKKYLLNAWASPEPENVRNNLIRAWNQIPAEVLRPSTLGLVRKLLI